MRCSADCDYSAGNGVGPLGIVCSKDTVGDCYRSPVTGVRASCLKVADRESILPASVDPLAVASVDIGIELEGLLYSMFCHSSDVSTACIDGCSSH